MKTPPPRVMSWHARKCKIQVLLGKGKTTENKTIRCKTENKYEKEIKW